MNRSSAHAAPPCGDLRWWFCPSSAPDNEGGAVHLRYHILHVQYETVRVGSPKPCGNFTEKMASRYCTVREFRLARESQITFWSTCGLRELCRLIGDWYRQCNGKRGGRQEEGSESGASSSSQLVDTSCLSSRLLKRSAALPPGYRGTQVTYGSTPIDILITVWRPQPDKFRYRTQTMYYSKRSTASSRALRSNSRGRVPQHVNRQVLLLYPLQ